MLRCDSGKPLDRHSRSARTPSQTQKPIKVNVKVAVLYKGYNRDTTRLVEVLRCRSHNGRLELHRISPGNKELRGSFGLAGP
jgi:hypothetical protein